ncbi:L-threonylcarbamoyladenylate synthase [Candidatus Woesearchaeota archaeon]|nr:L-threonylcarbamoyladenylate synthase [Candidatus Woesearchaeota archaeon]MBW3022017.1 L-threonylcarbamoyladenylate synthase [Candidatus Woesearchaeota archaeon]
MEIINVEEAQMKAPHLMKMIDEGVLFIHPTDTIYGIGCDATKPEAVDHVRKLKQRAKMPLSIIAPSKKWIFDNCDVPEDGKKYVNDLPGPVTLIVKLKNKKAVAKNVIHGLDAIGIRIPDHWISEFVSVYGNPLVSTSANVTGKEFMTSIDDLDVDIKKGMSFCLYEGEKKGRPSKIIHLEGETVKVRER